jgi:glycyl-tRNA synthetase beta chain
MSMTKSLLVELSVEELPPKSLRALGDAFAKSLADGLKSRGLMTDHSAVTAYATPRRLAVHISAVAPQALDQEVTKKLMPVSVGIGPDGKPAAALRKNLAKLGREALADMWPNATDGPDALFVQSDGKTDAVFFRTLAKGSSLQVGLQGALEDTIEGLPIPKVMSYQLADGWTSVNFVRPAHGLVALHGSEVVNVGVLGLEAGRETRGHRFEAQVELVVVQDADHYAQQMDRQGAVIVGFEQRRAEIVRQLQHAASALGLVPIDDDALLDEVTALVERPNVLTCAFEPEFRAVPSECLILTMKANQKYFPLLDAKGALTNRFLVVSNIRPEDASAIVQGNERVVRPRLADAKFFFDQDRKKSLASRLPMLDKVVYHAKLGSQGERVARVRAIAHAIGEQLGGTTLAAQADRAAQLAKADLVTDMVGEFPELQGVMGGYYARHDGESEAVALAIEDHYKPRFAGDALPRNEVGMVVALADKLETLLGMFQIGEVPTGDKDPFAMRRHALGVLRVCIENEMQYSIELLVELAGKAWDSAQAAIDGERRLSQSLAGVDVSANGPLLQEILDHERQARAVEREKLVAFMHDRLTTLMRDRGHSAQEVEAVLSLHSVRLSEVVRCLLAVRTFEEFPESASLAAANKRIANILKKSDLAPSMTLDATLLVEPAEKALAGALQNVQPLADKLFDNGEYTASLRELAVLRAPVDAFFDSVMVNADDPALRANRLALLAQLHAAMNRVADLSKLAT